MPPKKKVRFETNGNQNEDISHEALLHASPRVIEVGDLDDEVQSSSSTQMKEEDDDEDNTRDAWVDHLLDNVPIRMGRPEEPTLPQENTDQHFPSFNTSEAAVLELSRLLLPKETPSSALRRLQPGRTKNRPPPEFRTITSATTYLVSTGTFPADVYFDPREKFEEWLQHHMHTNDDGSSRPQSQIERVSRSTRPPNRTTPAANLTETVEDAPDDKDDDIFIDEAPDRERGLAWEIRWTTGDDPNAIHGPFNSAIMQQWAVAGFFAMAPALVRTVEKSNAEQIRSDWRDATKITNWNLS